MKVIDTDGDLDILVSPEDIKSIKDLVGRIETIAEGTQRRIILEHDQRQRPLHCKRIGSYEENGALVLKVYEELWRIEFAESTYNKNPVQDRYNSENKAIIYSTV
jgi:hypothetical protein